MEAVYDGLPRAGQFGKEGRATQIISRYIRNRRGQAMVELALILPVFLLLLVGMLEFGLVLHDYITVTEAARAGARAAVVAPARDNNAIITAAKNAAPSIEPAKLNVTIQPNDIASRTTNTQVTVTVTYPFEVPVSAIPNPLGGAGDVFEILPPTVDLTGTAIMRME